ncbi:hypothetical protein EJ06DRAFT_266508 [Trichodelitschia bisporula]|uniref:Aminoglycoside phosphotransferase domain-containing protein n=1 Tax=Trichodelitschia bisporula TaxID=703511 RepID=A0A6G1HIC1_9PEZI|nr:hypothetical protein EJ06DRAFT_266508 [Trichodelitschia bisporula]
MAPAPLLDPATPAPPPSPPTARLRAGSIGQREAESHVPTLKNQGKSDCAVQIIGIHDAHTGIPVADLSVNNAFWADPALQATLSAARSSVPIRPQLHMTLELSRSRLSQSQKALRRPALALREPSPPTTPGGHVKKPSYSSARTYVDDATIRRLTSGMWAVRKEAFVGAKQDGNRLLKQIEKQIAFAARCRAAGLRAVSTPEVYGIRVPEVVKGEVGAFTVDMEYIPFQDVRHVMMERDRAVNEWLVETAVEMVDANLNLSELVELRHVFPEFEKKATGIKAALRKSSLVTPAEIETFEHQIDRVMSSFRQLGRREVPIGPCHGDLTLANMLVDPENRELCVFDFLDCFVESPLQDIAKLLQDVRHQWFLTQTSIPEHRRARCVSILAMYCEKVKAAYCEYAFWDIVPLFEFFCLARILPYMTEESEKNCIMNGLERIYDSLFSGGIFPPQQYLAVTPVSRVNLDAPFTTKDRKVTVLVPALGRAMEEVYSSGAIKLLTLNGNGRPIIVNSIANLDVSNVSRIVLVVLRPLIESQCGSTTAFERLFDALPATTRSKLDFLYAPTQSPDAVETVAYAIREANILGPLFIKDADNDFAHCVVDGNYVTFTSIVRDDVVGMHAAQRFLRPDLVDAVRKSYVSFVYDNVVADVAYGSFLSSNFCCGGWGFLSAELFVHAAGTLRALLSTSGLETGCRASELRVVDVLWHLASEGHLFFGLKVNEYRDWGSEAAWLASLNVRF